MYNILIVDDEEIERNGIEFLITQKKYPFICYKAMNGVQALEMLNLWEIDVVMTDIKMPFMGGLELCEKIKELYPDILIVILSGYADFNYAKKAIQYDVKSYILKPVVMDDFYESMDKIVLTLKDNLTHIKQKDSTKDKAHYILNDKKVICDIIDLIEKNYNQDIGLEWVAKKMYLSSGYLSTLFKKETGKSVVQYITICRMNKAKELLIQTNMKIVDICQQVGYNNTSYFCLMFKKCFGITAISMRENSNMETFLEDKKDEDIYPFL